MDSVSREGLRTFKVCAGISPDRTLLNTTSELPLIQAGDSVIVRMKCLLYRVFQIVLSKSSFVYFGNRNWGGTANESSSLANNKFVRDFLFKGGRNMNIFETVCHTVTDAKDYVTDYFTEDTTTTRKKILILGAICTLVGIVAGFIFSPIKKGIYINISNNGSNNGIPPEDEE